MSRSGALTAVCAAVLLAVTGCGSAGSTSGPGASSPAPSINAARAGIPPGAVVGAVTRRVHTSKAAPPLPSSAESSTPHFGHWFHYRDGLSVKVGAPQGYIPSQWAKHSPGTPFVFSITVRNQTATAWNPSALHIHLLSGLQPDVQLFDRTNGVVARPLRLLPPRHQVVFVVGFWVTNPEPLQLLFKPGFGREDAMVTPAR